MIAAAEPRPIGRPRFEYDDKPDDEYFELFDPMMHQSLGDGCYRRRDLPAHE